MTDLSPKRDCGSKGVKQYYVFQGNVFFLHLHERSISFSFFRLQILYAYVPGIIYSYTRYTVGNSHACDKVAFFPNFSLCTSPSRQHAIKYVRLHGNPVRTHRLTPGRDPCSVERVAGAQTFCFRRKWTRRFPCFRYEVPHSVRTHR